MQALRERNMTVEQRDHEENCEEKKMPGNYAYIRTAASERSRQTADRRTIDELSLITGEIVRVLLDAREFAGRRLTRRCGLTAVVTALPFPLRVAVAARHRRLATSGAWTPMKRGPMRPDGRRIISAS